MAENDSGEKTEKPTSKRLSDARRKGNVARSAEVDIAFFLLMFLIVIKLGGPWIVYIIKQTYEFAFLNMDMQLTPLNVQTLYIRYFYYFWVLLLPIGFLFILGGLISMLLQVGWLVTWENLKFKFDFIKFDGLSKVFSVEGGKKLVIDLIKLFILTLITWIVVRKFVFDMLGLVNLNIVGIYLFLINLIVRVVLSLLIVYVVFAVLDFFWTKFQFTEKMKMTKSEVKDEFKQMEGDPQVKRRIMTLMMQESMKRMMQEVPQADVVITNPIHLAVAIKYDPAVGDAPVAVAKGKRLVAEKIKEIAREHDIPIVEDKPLARLLFKHSNIGEPIDTQFYAAVAEILANVYRLKNKKID
ncbi:MAG: flagellar biosynthesis protein FlhB [Candidatus Cloacimonetes bacterium]|nr:flagellar biosynthesis protein FlhB [Candidatus Cloacimonadota bacterium]